MSDCTGCFNGCTQIVSDQCVKYTGDDIDLLGIETGDPLSEVIEKAAEYLLSVYTGAGIATGIDLSDLCTLISGKISGDIINLNVILLALIDSICDLQTQVTADVSNMTTLNADYNLSTCLSGPGITVSSDTHDILQAVIYRLCGAVQDISALYGSLAGYVLKTEIKGYIEDYLNSIATNLMREKMVPYMAVPYFPPLGSLSYPVGSGFNGDGEGYGVWKDVFLCNGLHGTPDMKGRVPVGCTNMGGTTDSIVATHPYPTVVTGTVKYGANEVVLAVTNMPSHTHTITVTPNDPGHRHLFGGDQSLIANGGYSAKGPTVPPTNYDNIAVGSTPTQHFYTKSVSESNLQIDQTTGISISSTITNTGGGIAHSNIQPVIVSYYIMYIPTT